MTPGGVRGRSTDLNHPRTLLAAQLESTGNSSTAWACPTCGLPPGLFRDAVIPYRMTEEISSNLLTGPIVPSNFRSAVNGRLDGVVALA